MTNSNFLCKKTKDLTVFTLNMHDVKAASASGPLGQQWQRDF